MGVAWLCCMGNSISHWLVVHDCAQKLCLPRLLAVLLSHSSARGAMVAACRLRLLSFGIAERTQLAEPGTSQSELGWLRGFNDHYQIGQQLGRGSFGTVSLATELATGQECAVKVIPKQRSAQNRGSDTRCLQSSSWQGAAHQTLIDVPLAIQNRIFAFLDGICDRGQKKPYICPCPQDLNLPPLRCCHGREGVITGCADNCRAQSV